MEAPDGTKLSKKLGFVVAARPGSRNFDHALRLAETALGQHTGVFVYLIREGVAGAAHPAWRELSARGLKLFGCAYSARQRSIPLEEPVTWVGMTILNDLMVECDKVLAF